jgi:hypothetical protein
MKLNSFFLGITESRFPWVNSGGYRLPESPQGMRTPVDNTDNAGGAAVYSAAAANDGFMFADDTMKSEMRGTISDLKREPLKTP